LRSARSDRFGPGQLAAFMTGLLTVYVALQSPLDAFSGLLLSAHMTQHLLLMMVAPPLLWLGAPALPLLSGLPVWLTKEILGPFLGWPALHRFGRAITHPVFAWISFVACTWAWHVPALYEAALRSRALHDLEHVTFLVTALLFWFPVVSPWPSVQRWSRWAMIPYLVLADISNTVLSAIFCFAERVIYTPYAQAPRVLELSPLDDQALAGAIMWVPGSIAFLLPVAVLVPRLLSRRGVRPSEAAASGATAVASPMAGGVTQAARAPFDLLRTRFGPLLRRLAFRRIIQALLFLLAVAIVVDGLAGTQIGSMNLAGVLPWTHWRGLLVIGLLVAGNVFCGVCPFTLPRGLAKRMGAKFRWPRALRSKWPAVALLVMFLWAYEVFQLWDRPSWTAWIIVGYFVASFAVDALFRGASFCKYVCPIGQFNFVHALVSPLEVRARNTEVCGTCASHDCLRGGVGGPGCQVDLLVPEKAGSLDCTLCLDCIRACPHDNVALGAVRPAQNLELARSRFARRPDVAVLAIVLAFAAFLNAAGMVGPAQSAVEGWLLQSGLDVHISLAAAMGSLTLAGLLLAPLVVFALACVFRRVGGNRELRREAWARIALSLVPIGLAMWSVHFLFHFLTSAATAIPVTQQFVAEFGIAGMGTPQWGLCCCGPAPGWLLPLEMLLLDLGLLLSLFVGWRGATRSGAAGLARTARFLPGALVAAALWMAGLWILFQPMQMRGTMLA